MVEEFSDLSDNTVNDSSNIWTFLCSRWFFGDGD